MTEETSETLKSIANDVLSKYNIKLYELCRYDTTNEVYIYDWTYKKHIVVFRPTDQKIINMFHDDNLNIIRKNYIESYDKNNIKETPKDTKNNTEIYFCKLCNESFGRKFNLIIHLRKIMPCSTHNDVIERDVYLRELVYDKNNRDIFKCEYCKKGFTNKSNRYRHQKNCKTLVTKVQPLMIE